MLYQRAILLWYVLKILQQMNQLFHCLKNKKNLKLDKTYALSYAGLADSSCSKSN